MAEEDRRRDLLVNTYADLQEEIKDAISKSSADTFFRSPLEDLQKTVYSMESMVEDMEQSERASPRYIFMTRKFLPQLEEAANFLLIELPAASSRVGTFKVGICQALGIELPASTTRAYSYKNDLEIIRKRLKNIFANYVQEELDKLAQADQEVGDEVAPIRGLLRYLLSKIRDEASKPSSNPVFQNIKVILDSLETEFHNRRQHTNGDMFLAHTNTSQLLHLLKEVKLLHRFLNGDHGLDIPNLLRERENALRNFVTNDVVSCLKQLDRKYEKLQREKTIWNEILFLLLAVASLALILFMPEKYHSNNDLLMIVFLLISIILFSGILVMDVYNHIRLGWSGDQRQRLNSDNPCCGGFCLLSFVATVLGVVFLAVAMVVTDEPKKYDIFLNFRGSDDIRYTVAGVFHSSLEKANFSTFFDERNSRKTKRFLEEIESAISTSVGAITIFSEYYGESEYCLDELLLILEREKTHKGYIIRPIFYDVEPDDLTNPESKFGQGLQKHYKTQRKDKVEEWKEALEHVTLIGGDVHKSNRQHLDELVNKVVEDFKNQLRNKRDTTYTLQLRNVKLVIDLRSWKLYVLVKALTS